MMHRKRTSLVLATVLASIFSVSTGPGWAKTATAPAAPPPGNTVTVEPTDKAYQKYGAVLRDERQILEKQADRHIAGIERLYDRGLNVLFALLGLIGTVLLLALALLRWLFHSTRKELRDELKDMMKGYAKESVDLEAEDLRKRLRSLKNEVDDINAYKSRGVVWITYRDDQPIEPILSELRGFDIANALRTPISSPDDLELDHPDLVILSFDGSDLGRAVLERTVGLIESARPPIPLLIFTYNFGGKEIRLSEPEFKILKNFDWYLPANVPATLISQTTSLLRRSSRRMR